MSRVDELLARFNARNEEKIEEEKADARAAFTICFTKVEILRSFLQLAHARTIVLLKVPRDCTEVDFEIDEEAGTARPAIRFTRDVELPVEAAVIASTMGRFFRALCREWAFELRQAAEDEVAFQQLEEWRAKNPETFDDFAFRFRKWAA